MELLVARSTIAIQNRLWITIYIYVLKIYVAILKYILYHFFYWPFDLHGTQTTDNDTNTETRQNETLFQNKSQIYWRFTCIK